MRQQLSMLATPASKNIPTINRSTLREIRNPIFALPSAKNIQALPPEQRRILSTLLRELSAEAREKGKDSWGKAKYMIAAYWMVTAVYAKHIARVLDPRLN